MLRKVIEKHSRGILKEVYSKLMRLVVFSSPGSVMLVTEGTQALALYLSSHPY